jgi:hypothetical protein
MVDSIQDPRPSQQLTWQRLVVITLLVMLVGVVGGAVVIGRIGMFARPLLPYTVPIYLLLWLPVFIGGLLFWRPGAFLCGERCFTRAGQQ